MTVTLGRIIELGPLRIVALSDNTVAASHCKGSFFGTGQKGPVAVLIKQGKVLTAFGPEGMPMTRAQVETLCPGAWRTALEAR